MRQAVLFLVLLVVTASAMLISMPKPMPQVPAEGDTGPRQHAAIPGIPGSPSALSACGTVGVGDWQLTGNLSAATSEDVCLTLSSTTGARTIDLNGFTITGRIRCSASGCFDTWVTGGINGTTSTLTCASRETNATNPGQGPCMWFTNGPSNASGVQLHVSDIYVVNTATCAVAGDTKRNMTLDWNWTSGAAASDNPIWVEYTQVTLGGCNPSNRTTNISIVDGDQTLVHNNHVTCEDDANTCEGIAFFASDRSIVRNNWIIVEAASGGAITARGIIFDNDNAVATQDNEAYENYIRCNDRRCIRIRGSLNAHIYDNEFNACSATATAGCFDLQEATVDPAGQAQYDSIWEGNIINMTGGNAFGVRGSRGHIVRNNTFTGSTGRVVVLDTIGGINSDFTFENNSGHTGLSASTIANTGGGTALITSCPVGTLVVTGTGVNKTHTENNDCVSGSPLVSLSPTSVTFTPSQQINTSSSPRDITLTNTGGAILNITSIVLTTGTQFSLDEDCGATLAVDAFCTITVTFTPTSASPPTGEVKNDSVVITTDAASSPDSVALSGTAISKPQVQVRAAPH